MKNNIVPCLLVKEEEFWLPYVLESLAQVKWDRYVIYDINSQDSTRPIIEWWMSKHKDFDIQYSPLPMCDPIVQGKFRNSMISEADSECYFIVDGDEIYNKEDLTEIQKAAFDLIDANFYHPNYKYGVIRRIEMNKELTHRYSEKRTHHRLYHHTAYWRGTHPGEEAVYPQTRASEQHFPHVYCYHLHNAERSSFGDTAVPGRAKRKSQRTYHPGELEPFNLLDEVPILRKPIAHWPVAPALKELQEKFHD